MRLTLRSDAIGDGPILPGSPFRSIGLPRIELLILMSAMLASWYLIVALKEGDATVPGSNPVKEARKLLRRSIGPATDCRLYSQPKGVELGLFSFGSKLLTKREP